MTDEIVYSRINEDGGVTCGNCGSVHSLLPPDTVTVLNTLHCETCRVNGRPPTTFLRPDEQLAFYRKRGMEPAPVVDTPSLEWNGTAYVAVPPSAPATVAATEPTSTEA